MEDASPTDAVANQSLERRAPVSLAALYFTGQGDVSLDGDTQTRHSLHEVYEDFDTIELNPNKFD